MYKRILCFAGVLLFSFGTAVLSQPAAEVDTFSAQCFRRAANGRDQETFNCTIAVWKPSKIYEALTNTDKELRAYVDSTVDGRLRKLDEKLVAVTVASNLRSTVVADLTTALPNDPAFVVAVVKSLTEKSKSDPVLRETLKSLITELSQTPKTTTKVQ